MFQSSTAAYTAMCRSIFFKHDSLAVSSLSWFPCYNLTMVKKWLKKLTNLFSTWMFVSGSCYFLHEIALQETFLHNFLTMGESWRRSHGQRIIFENLDRSSHSTCTVTFIWLQQLLATKVWNWRHPVSNFFSKVDLRNKHFCHRAQRRHIWTY